MVSEPRAGLPIETPLLIAFSPLRRIPVVRRSIRSVWESGGMSEQVKHRDTVFAIRSEFGDVFRYSVTELKFPLG